MLNLRLNYPSIEQESGIFQQYIATLPQQEKDALLYPGSFTPDAATCVSLNNWLELPPGTLEQYADVAITCSGNNAIHCILTLFKDRTSGAASEPFTYNSFIMSAGNLGYQLHTLDCDEDGILPDALQRHLETGRSRLVYLQPTINNPTCTIMPLERRQAVAAVLRSFSGVYLVEDDAYRFLHPDPPPTFLSLMPERTIHLCSFSKTFNSFVRAAYLIYPKGVLGAGLENVLRFTGNTSSAIFNGFIRYLVEEKEQLHGVIAEKRHIAAVLQEQFAAIFEGLTYYTFPSSYHIWIPLQEGVSAGAVVRSFRDRGIDLMSSESFSVNGRQDHIRVALGAARNSEALVPALELIAKELREGSWKPGI
jgi:DNA-binding transcriptional MocR family regulator